MGLFIPSRQIPLLLAFLSFGAAYAQEDKAPAAGGDDASSVAKKLQNPLANVISLPLQFNFNFGFGPEEKTQTVLNFQPVVPTRLSDGLLLINRAILPVVSNPEPFQQTGISDLNYTGWFSPLKSKGITWGVGPVLSLPIGTPEELGSGKFAVGPSAVVVKSSGKFVMGGLANNIWSVAGDDTRADVSFFTTQIFVNYNLKKGKSLSFAPLITANWKADADQRWTVPLGAGIGQVLPVGIVYLNLALQYYANVVHPDIGPLSSLRFQIAVAIPK